MTASQGGAISRRQLIALGLGSTGVGHRVLVGELYRIYAGTYSITREVEREGVWWAGALSAGEDAVLSHMSAAHLWGIVKYSGPTEVTRLSSASRRLNSPEKFAPKTLGTAVMKGSSRIPRLKIHRTRSLHPTEVTERRGLPVTTPARTFVDVAGSIGKGQLGKLLHEAAREGLLNLVEVRAAMDRARGKKGIRRLREILEAWDPQTGRTRNEFEKLMLDLCYKARLPTPVVNAKVAGYEVDFLFPDHGLIVETDGARDHDTPFGRERDRERDSDLQLKGFLTLRLTWNMLSKQPEASMQKVEEHLLLCESEGRAAAPGWDSAST